jgi:5-hydroxyisourate hydrolase
MSRITTHVLDTTRGRPAEGVAVELAHLGDDHAWVDLGGGVTNSDGRLTDLLADTYVLAPGVYRLSFDTGSYFDSATFYPWVEIVFAVQRDEHHHVPLLVSPFGYSTYRGS